MKTVNKKCFVNYDSVLDSFLEEEENKLTAIKLRQAEIENMCNTYFDGSTEKLKSTLIELDREVIINQVDQIVLNLDHSNSENLSIKISELFKLSDSTTRKLIRKNSIEILNSENYVHVKDLLDYIDFME